MFYQLRRHLQSRALLCFSETQHLTLNGISDQLPLLPDAIEELVIEGQPGDTLHLDGLERLTRLRTLSAIIDLTSLKPLASVPSLCALVVGRYTPLDLSPLVGLPRLRYIFAPPKSVIPKELEGHVFTMSDDIPF